MVFAGPGWGGLEAKTSILSQAPVRVEGPSKKRSMNSANSAAISQHLLCVHALFWKLRIYLNKIGISEPCLDGVIFQVGDSQSSLSPESSVFALPATLAVE